MRALTLDRLAADAALKQVDLLKLDAGAGFAIVRGARGLLASAAIAIYTEFFPCRI